MLGGCREGFGSSLSRGPEDRGGYISSEEKGLFFLSSLQRESSLKHPELQAPSLLNTAT